MYFNILLGKSVLLCCIYILINTLDYNSSSYSHIAIHSDYYTTFKNKIIYQKNVEMCVGIGAVYKRDYMGR